MSVLADDGRVTVRDATAADRAFLRRLFIATHPEFAALPPDVAESISGHQYDIRERQYRDRFPTMRDQVVEVDGDPVGRLSTAPRAGTIIVVDIAVVPDGQRGGVGSAVLAQLLADAERRGVTVELSVHGDNPAVRLYERLGFEASAHAETAGYLRMRRRPG